MANLECLSLHQFVSRRQYVKNNDSPRAARLRDFMGLEEDDRSFDGFFVYPEELCMLDQNNVSILVIGRSEYEAVNQEEFEQLEKVLFKYYVEEYC